MRTRYFIGLGLIVILLVMTSSIVVAQTIKDPTTVKVPAEYQNKHMPEGWWTDAKIIHEGKEIYEGLENAMVNCSACHGLDGKPMLPGARDFRDIAYINKMTDSYWFWRVSEGVTDTQMQGFKKMLKEEKIWKVISYEHTMTHKGVGAEHKH